MRVTMYVKSISSCLLYFSGMFKEYFQIASIFGMRQALSWIFLTFRYWSVQIIIEKGPETRTLVPCPWVHSINEIVYWPPKGKRLGLYLVNWTEPGKDWKSYEIIQSTLESGRKDEDDQPLKIQRLKMELVSISPLFFLVKVWKI